jgi:hypothetical protein
MTNERCERLIKEARIHYDWLRQSGLSLDDIEVTARELLRLWNIEATLEVARLQKETRERWEEQRRQRNERARENGPDYEASGVII